MWLAPGARWPGRLGRESEVAPEAHPTRPAPRSIVDSLRTLVRPRGHHLSSVAPAAPGRPDGAAPEGLLPHAVPPRDAEGADRRYAW